MNYRAMLKKHVKGRYGNWVLVQLPSGNWAGLWGAVIGVEEMCAAVLTGSPRFDGDSLAISHADRGDALRTIIAGIEGEARRDAEAMKPFLKKARLALLCEEV